MTNKPRRRHLGKGIRYILMKGSHFIGSVGNLVWNENVIIWQSLGHD